MFFRKQSCRLAAAVLAAMLTTAPAHAEWVDNGDQVIDGTQMHTTVYHDRGYAVFSNSCGSQRLTQSELQGGAKPTDIIPCPRPDSTAANPPPTTAPTQRLWAAVAAGLDNGFLGIGSKVGVGLGQDYSTKADAEAGALQSCRKRVSGCKIVGSWNTGCYYITTGNGGGVAWGSGRTAQDAYDACRSRVTNCNTNAIGRCYPD